MQSLRIMNIYILAKFHHLCCLVFELRNLEEKEEKEEKKIYDARHHANPYILSTTVLSDNQCISEVIPLCARF